MKQGNFLTKLVMILFFAGVLLYIGGAVWRSFSSPFTTVPVYSFEVREMAEADGWLVREETVLPPGAGIVDIVPGEGEKLGAGQTVAVLYRDESALQRRQAIRQLEMELSQLEHSLRQDDGPSDAAKLDDELFAAMLDLRRGAAFSDYSNLENQALSLKSLMFRREYTYSGGGAEIEALITATSARIGRLQEESASDITRIVTDQPGTYSGLSDGYESIFTPASLNGLTVSALEGLASASPADTGGAVGKLITGSRWYFAAFLPEADARSLTQGGLVSVVFTRDFQGEAAMRVEQVSRAEGGRAAVVFSSTRNLSNITLLRRQRVEVVFSRQTGLRVPKKALRVLEDGVPGVYALAGTLAQFRPVKILAEGGDFYLLAPAEGTSPARELKAGDRVILASDELYEGKVVK